MKQYALAILVAAAAGMNEYATDWENTIPQCEGESLSCGNDGLCEEGNVCAEFFGFQKCFKIWRFDFCSAGCDEGMVNNPRRYCECITPEELTNMFCEAPEEPAEPEEEEPEVVFAQEGENCGGFDETTGMPFPDCAEGFVCETTAEVSIPGSGNTCVEEIGGDYYNGVLQDYAASFISTGFGVANTQPDDFQNDPEEEETTTVETIDIDPTTTETGDEEEQPA